MRSDEQIINEYFTLLSATEYPCVGAKASLAKGQIKCLVADHMACPVDDWKILQFLWDFVDEYRKSNKSFHSASVIFRNPYINDERQFDELLWKRLKALDILDKEKYQHDKRVDADPASPRFSYSLKEEAFFIIGLHPANSRRSRQFGYPVLVFNPHAEFEKLRLANRYENLKNTIRKRDIKYSGSVNPIVSDFGETSEIFQYSGVQHDATWKCPLTDHKKT